MKILFVNPSLRRGSPSKYLPVGIAAVMTYVKARGFDFDLLDVDINDLEDDVIESYISTHAYDVVLSGSIVTHYKWMKWFVDMVKEHQPNAFVVVGNSVGGSAPSVFLNHCKANAVVIGEGEVTTAELLESLRDGKPWQGIQGIAFLDDQRKFHQTERRAGVAIDTLPMLDWTPFDTEAYFERSYAEAGGLVFKDGQAPRVMPVTTARGCAFRCTFCHFVFWNDPYRHRSAENIIKEIRFNVETYGANYINFWDDLSFANLDQVEIVCDEILKSGMDFYWSAAIRVDLFGNPKEPLEKRERIAKKMAQSKCLSAGFSLESGSKEILKMMNKHIEPEYFFETIRILKNAGVNVSNSVVFGYPIETPATIKQTFDMCLQAGVYPSIGFLLPLPYTGMYEYAKKHGYIKDENAYLGSITERQDICLNMTTMSNEEIMGHITEGAGRLNKALELHLAKDRLIRTGGYNNHRKSTRNNPAPPIDTKNMKRIKNDVSFNYSQAIFKMDTESPTEKVEKDTD